MATVGKLGDDGEHQTGKNTVTESPSHTQMYQITRRSDDLVIAVWKDPERNIIPVNAEGLVHSLDKCCSNFRDNRTIELKHDAGDRFCIPWVLAAKWKWMKDIIKLTYGSDEKAKKMIDEDKFELMESNSTKILPAHWDNIVVPWLYVKIKLIDDEDAIEKQPDIKPGETQYQAAVKYRIDFYVKSPYGAPRDEFLQTKIYDGPAEIEKSRGKLIPVIEEINTVTFGSKKNTGRMGNVATNGLVLDVGDEVKPKRLHIRSPLLLNALRSIVQYSSHLPFEDNTEVFTDGLFPFPFHDLYHHRQELLDYKSETSGPRANHTPEYNAECDRHIDILIDYLDNEPTIQLLPVKERWQLKVPTTTFPGFWLLMKPGTDVYVQEHGQLNAYVVDLVTGGLDHSAWSFSAGSYYVRVWHLVFNGKLIERRSKTIEVAVFDGERDIVSLPIFPTSFQDKLDGGSLRNSLIERGRRFFKLAKGPTYLDYTGAGLKPGWKKYNRARVVVEHQSLPWTLKEFSPKEFAHSGEWDLTWKGDNLPKVAKNRSPLGYEVQNNYAGLGERARAPRCECTQCKIIDGRKGTYISPTFSSYVSIDPLKAEGLSEHQALVCMSHMFGFVLKDRAYDILDLGGLIEPKLADRAIDELVLRPEKNKDTIKAIARTYTDSDSQADLFSVDFIRGKGEGQIFLLHGPPGTGKTLTAESIAEYTKRPLLSITAADLGHEPVDLERNLLRFFKSATAWDAIVLLDEADVYLERRSSNDLRRNSIVSIFLRALDYFEGILFFTTNRVGQFDEAFMSRIHVAIGYDPLDNKAREQIWDNLFRKLKDNHKNGGPRIDYDYDAKQYVRKSDDVRGLQWNGREIRNAFQTAVALAMAESKVAREKGLPEEDCIPQVTEAHLIQVVNMSSAFKRYIKATHEGIDDADLAYKLGNRNDLLNAESE